MTMSPSMKSSCLDFLFLRNIVLLVLICIGSSCPGALINFDIISSDSSMSEDLGECEVIYDLSEKSFAM